MDYKMHYLFEVNEIYRKAELLWLWYDYQTEIYDQGLWSTYPSPHDETMVLHRLPEARKLSSQNAYKIRNMMMDIAKHYSVPDEEMQAAKNNLNKIRSKMSKKIEDYLYLKERGEFKFIEDLIE